MSLITQEIERKRGPSKPRAKGRGNILPSGRAARNACLAKYREIAVKRGYVWKLTGEQFDELTSQPCHYCGAAPSNTWTLPQGNGPFVYSGIDRVDNTRGYEPDNVVPCCAICNRAKGPRSKAEFLVWVHQIVAKST